jgi:hypothetical protein
MLAQTIAFYTENNTNSKIGVQGAMVVETNETPTKRAKKGKDKRGRMPLPIRILKGPKREKFLLL